MNFVIPRIRLSAAVGTARVAWRTAGLLLALALPLVPGHAETISEKFAAHTKGAVTAVDHGAWDKVLRAHLLAGIDGINRLAYQRLVGAPQREIKTYIQALERVDPATLDRPEQQAYWINLYNAATLDAVLGRYPVKSINDVDLKDANGVPGVGPWKAKLVTVGGLALTLDEIENQIVRAVYKDARAHYALNCLSIGCPNLRPVALTGANIEAQLNLAATEFVNHPRGIMFADGKVTASSIYDWFADDFGGLPGILAHLRKYAEPSLMAKLPGIKGIDVYTYDWALADASN